jgi:hypothetical protein
MSTSEFFSILADWLLYAPVQHALVMLLALLNLAMWPFVYLSLYLWRQRLISVELRHESIMQKHIGYNSELEKHRRDTLDKLEEVRAEVTNPKDVHRS